MTAPGNADSPPLVAFVECSHCKGAGPYRVVTDERGTVREPVTEPKEVPPGVRIEALCERCGIWHLIDLRPIGDDPITTTKPRCWVCGHAPLAVTVTGRLAHKRCQFSAEDKFSRVRCTLREGHAGPHEDKDGWNWR